MKEDASTKSRWVVDDREAGTFRINRRVFVDPEILAIEQREVFNRAWLYVGHESEVSSVGDFVSRKVAGRPLIMVRDDAGKVRVHFNACTHRGNLVCREPAGNARNFACFYHAWNFNLKGELIGVPGSDAYAPAFNKAELGLQSPAHTDSYRGMVFVSFDPAAPSLVDYLGGAREYIDYMADFGGEQVEIAPGAQAYSMKANWKLLVENSFDSYHGMATHRRYFTEYLPAMGVDIQAWTAGSTKLEESRGIALGNGHAVTEKPQRATMLSTKAGGELAEIRARLVQSFGEERASRIADYARNLFIFPNLVMIADWRTIRTFYPVSPDYMEVNAWAVLPKSESPELRQLRLENFISFLGPGGFGTPDDVTGLEGCQRGFAAHGAEPGWSDVSRGMHRDQPLSTDELQMRAFWRRWHALVTGEKGPTDLDRLLKPVKAA